MTFTSSGRNSPPRKSPNCICARVWRGQDRLLVDPEKITLTAANQSKGKNDFRGYRVSDDGRYIAVGIVPGGAEDNSELHVFEIASGRETGDAILHGADGLGTYWLPDSRSFVYERTQPVPPGAPGTELEQPSGSYLHVLGTDPEKDTLVFGYGAVKSIDVDPKLDSTVLTQPGARYVIGVLDDAHGITPNNAYYIAPVDSIGKPNPVWRKVADVADGVKQIIVHHDDLYLLTYKDAPRYKVLRLDARKPNLAGAEIVVPPGEAVITSMSAAQDALYVDLMDGGINRLLRVPYGPNPTAERVALPFDATFSVQTDPRLPGALLFMESWVKARKAYAFDPATKQVTDTGIQPAGPYGEPANLESVEVKVRSYDGTSVPLSIVYLKGMKMDGSNPTFLTGYGAYGDSESAGFATTNLAWYEQGGVSATCHVRGGGEYGEEWHLAGKGPSKPNTWRDLIACAQYLIDNKYTSSARLGGLAASAGGILIGRAITERPDSSA